MDGWAQTALGCGRTPLAICARDAAVVSYRCDPSLRLTQVDTFEQLFHPHEELVRGSEPSLQERQRRCAAPTAA
jgi:hypothetical protein